MYVGMAAYSFMGRRCEDYNGNNERPLVIVTIKENWRNRCSLIRNMSQPFIELQNAGFCTLRCAYMLWDRNGINSWVIIFLIFFRANFKLRRHVFCAKCKTTKKAMRALISGFFCTIIIIMTLFHKFEVSELSAGKMVAQINVRKKKKLSILMNSTAINVTWAWTWINFSQVMQTEDVMPITFFFLLASLWSVMPPENWSDSLPQ